ncbi:MAG: hypothetical protein M5R36_17945 [Deltaproteobacteria bacterium]|nr:hypothetical protein [Deltaproteobacteria bacterium]
MRGVYHSPASMKARPKVNDPHKTIISVTTIFFVDKWRTVIFYGPLNVDVSLTEESYETETFVVDRWMRVARGDGGRFDLMFRGKR